MPDGRFGIEVVGKQRFKIQRTWEQDGYRVAEPQWLSDQPVDPNSQEYGELDELSSEVESMVDGVLERIRFVCSIGKYSTAMWLALHCWGSVVPSVGCAKGCCEGWCWRGTLRDGHAAIIVASGTEAEGARGQARGHRILGSICGRYDDSRAKLRDECHRFQAQAGVRQGQLEGGAWWMEAWVNEDVTCVSQASAEARDNAMRTRDV